jgi:hypothetical protein
VSAMDTCGPSVSVMLGAAGRTEPTGASCFTTVAGAATATFSGLALAGAACGGGAAGGVTGGPIATAGICGRGFAIGAASGGFGRTPAAEAGFAPAAAGFGAPWWGAGGTPRCVVARDAGDTSGFASGGSAFGAPSFGAFEKRLIALLQKIPPRGLELDRKEEHGDRSRPHR